MSQEKKERVGILMPPSQVAEIDALYPLHGHASRSDFVCKAVEFYTGFLQQGSSEFYMDKTTLAFLEEQLGRLENRICRQLFRICVLSDMRGAGDGLSHVRQPVPGRTKGDAGGTAEDLRPGREADNRQHPLRQDLRLPAGRSGAGGR